MLFILASLPLCFNLFFNNSSVIGETIYKNKAVLIDLRQRSVFNESISIEIPPYAVPGSEHIEVDAIADIMGPSINNLEKLIRIPYGCGEQNMVNFVPNVVALEYLKATDQLDRNKDIQFRALRNIETGYQRQLTYKRNDGSYSAFGSADPSGK
jgi:CD109 antigen